MQGSHGITVFLSIEWTSQKKRKLEDDWPESIFPQALPIMCFSSRGDALLHRCNGFCKAGSCNLALCNLTLCNLALCNLALFNLALCHLALCNLALYNLALCNLALCNLALFNSALW